MSKKICGKCSLSKSVSCFSKNRKRPDGLQDWCKDCRSDHYRKNRSSELLVMSKYREMNADKRRANDRQRRLAVRSDPERLEKHRAEMRVFVRNYRSRNAEKELARRAVGSAIRYGKIARPSVCSECGTDCTPQAHHDSYDKEFHLSVRWLCVSCHAKVHRKHKQNPKP